MNPARTQVRCPQCGAPLPAAVEQIVDPAHDPAAKSRLLSGTLNLLRCPACRYEGVLAAPLLYHDAEKELLLHHFPAELGLPKDEQERVLGQLLNQVINRLPAEKRKGYLLQPQAALTLQGLIDRVLEADGVTREQVEAQRARLRLLQDLLRTPPDQLEAWAREHDAALDSIFFQIASLTVQNTHEPQAREQLELRLERLMELTTAGRRMLAQENELRAAAESLQQAGEELTRERVLELILAAPNDDRVLALASLARPALDYTFFQQLTERIEAAAEDTEKKRLGALREMLLRLTQEIDQAQQARVAESAELLRSILAAPDLRQALQEALPQIDDLFLAVLEANLRAARDRQQTETAARLEQAATLLRQLLRESMPPGLQLAQKVLELESDDEARAALDAGRAQIDEHLLQALAGAALRMQEAGHPEQADRLRRLHRHALGLSMRARLENA